MMRPLESILVTSAEFKPRLFSNFLGLISLGPCPVKYFGPVKTPYVVPCRAALSDKLAHDQLR